MMKLKKEVQKRFQSLRQESESWRSTWKDISKYIRPTRGFFDDQPNQGRSLDHKTVLDGHASRAVRVLAAGMTSGLTSPSRPWFKLGVPDADMMDEQEVKIWLATVQQRMMAVFEKSNIYGVLHSVYEELGTFSTACAMILPDYKTVIRGRVFTAGEYMIGHDADNRVNTFGRTFHQTVAQLVSEYGIENVSDSVKNMYETGNVDAWIKCCQLIEPNDDRIPEKKDYKNKEYRSITWEDGSSCDRILRIGGFDDFPVIAPRWDLTTSNDSYGKGPGWDALGDVKMLQKLQRDKLIGLDKLINPPIQIDSNIQGEANTLPGGITRYSGATSNAGVRPAYQVDPNLQAIEFSIDKTKQAIDSTFYVDLFLMMLSSDRRQMTAKEVVERHEEKLLMLGPVLERLEGELLDPLITRTFNIMFESGMIPEIPQILQGQDMKIEYISMLAQAQKMVGTTAIEQTMSFVGSMAALFPEVADVVDADEMVMEYGNMLGVPPKGIRTPEQVAEIRARKQKQAEQLQQAQNAMNVVQGAKVLSDTKIGENSALDGLLQGVRQPGRV